MMARGSAGDGAALGEGAALGAGLAEGVALALADGDAEGVAADSANDATLPQKAKIAEERTRRDLILIDELRST